MSHDYMLILSQVDFNKVAAKTGHKYAKNARAVFKRAWEKLKDNGGDGSLQAESPGDEDEEIAGVKPKTKLALKVGKATSRKSSAGARRTKRPTKKEREAIAMAVAKAKAKAGAEEDKNEDEEYGVEEGVGAATGELGDDTISDVDSSATQPMDDDELEASLLGISVEEFKSLAEETQWFHSAPTPEAAPSSDDEV